MRTLLRCLLCLLLLLGGRPAFAQTCTGHFLLDMNWIMGAVCWECILPISIGKIPIYTGGQEDNQSNPANPICICPPYWPFPRIGLSIGYWEPARAMEMVRQPYCMAGLGGKVINGGSAGNGNGSGNSEVLPAWLRFSDQETRSTAPGQAGVKSSRYNVHYYQFPLLAILQVIKDFPCLEQGGMDIAYLSEIDPTASDDEMALVIGPEASLFANQLAQAACAVDAVSAGVTFGLKELFWCSGSNGSVFPLSNRVQNHHGGVQGSALLAHRNLFKLHRLLIADNYAGAEALCGPTKAPLMDKTNYKTELLYPVPNSVRTSNALGTQPCCQPLGRFDGLWSAGKEFPTREDFIYLVFRKRNCCLSYY